MTPEEVMKKAIAGLLRDRWPDLPDDQLCKGHHNPVHDYLDYCDGPCVTVTGEPWEPPGDRE